MDRQYPPYNYNGSHHQQPHHEEYPDYQYSYPPSNTTQPQQQDARYLQTMRPYDSSNNDSRSSLANDEKYMHRQGSYADSDAETRVASLYDEKNAQSSTSTSTTMAPPTTAGMNNNDAKGEEYIPPAVPRPRNNNKNFQPGHLSRGSIAIQAAAAGEIPKKEALKMWRSDEHHGTFTAGGKGRAAMRCCCCTLIFAVILIVGIVAAFLLWVSSYSTLIRSLVCRSVDYVSSLTLLLNHALVDNAIYVISSYMLLYTGTCFARTGPTPKYSIPRNNSATRRFTAVISHLIRLQSELCACFESIYGLNILRMLLLTRYSDFHPVLFVP